MENHYSQFKGWKIVDFGMTTDDLGDWPTYTLQHPRTKQRVLITLSCDPEGNAPGFMFIDEV